MITPLYCLNVIIHSCPNPQYWFGCTVLITEGPVELTDHYDDVIMTMLASQITSLTVVYSIVCSGVNQRKHQSSASLAFVWEIHRGPVNFPHKWPVTRKMFPFDDVIMWLGLYPMKYAHVCAVLGLVWPCNHFWDYYHFLLILFSVWCVLYDIKSSTRQYSSASRSFPNHNRIKQNK